MNQLPFRAVVSDMDGTLLNANHVVGDFTLDTLEKLSQSGVDIMLATGRNYVDIAAILRKMNLKNAYAITSNGAEVHDLQGNLIYSSYIPEELAFEIMQTPYDKKNIFLNTYQGDEWFVSIDIPEMNKYHKDSGFVGQVVDFSQHHGRKTEKVFFIGRTTEDLLPLEKYLTEKYGDRCAIFYTSLQSLEVMNKGVCKANGLLKILEQRDYDIRQCIAFGDSLNDVEMLAEVGKGLVMGNADPRLKVALPNNEQIGLNKDEAVASYLRAIFGVY